MAQWRLVAWVLASAWFVLSPPFSAEADEDKPRFHLREVEGGKDFPGDERARAHLERHGFVVLPRVHKQIFSPYIGGALPHYITTDSAHRTYHVLFEEALATVERSQAQVWGPHLKRLCSILATETSAGGEPWKAAREHALACVAVAARLLGQTIVLPPALDRTVAKELALIAGAESTVQSPVRGGPEDYAAYRPRGLYEGDPALEAWFRAAQWLGRTPFRVRDERETRAACLLVRAIQGDASLREAFEKTQRLYGALLGPADDLTVAEYATAMAGGAWPKNHAAMRAKLAALRAPEINDQLLAPAAWKRFRHETKGLRLMPKGRTADVWLAQALAGANPGQGALGGLPSALALGSARAAEHVPGGARTAKLVAAYKAGFTKRLGETLYGDTLRAQALLFDRAGPLHGAGTAITGTNGTPDVRPAWFREPAWQDRLLTTGLASWASLRHAWVLHGKTVAFLLSATRDPEGVVEPAPRYYAALAALARSLRSHLEDAGAFAQDPKVVAQRIATVLGRLGTGAIPTQADYAVLTDHETAAEVLFRDREATPAVYQDIAAHLRAWLAGTGQLTKAELDALAGTGGGKLSTYLTSFATLMGELREIALTELAGRPLSEEQLLLIRYYGKSIGTLQFFEGNSYMHPDRQMGLAVDVSSDPRRGTRRHAAVGGALELYVVLPLHGGGRRLYRGAVYSYYAFDAEQPVTDTAWRGRVTSGDVPPVAPSMRSYTVQPRVEPVLAAIAAGSQPDAARQLHDKRIADALLLRLRNAPLTTPAEDEHLAWVGESLLRYAAGRERIRIRDALIDRLGRTAGSKQEPLDRYRGVGTDELAAFGCRGADALGAVLRPEDHPRIAVLLASPPSGSRTHARQRLVRALLGSDADDAQLLAIARPLFLHKDAQVRRWALEVATFRYRWHDEDVPSAPAAALAAYLPRETDASTQALALERLGDLARSPLAREAIRPAVKTAVGLIDSKVPAVRAMAIRLVGRLHVSAAAKPLLAQLRSLEPAQDELRLPLLRALGRSLAGVVEPTAEVPVALLEEVLRVLAAGCRNPTWRVAVASLEGLQGMGTPKAVAALGAILLDRKLDPGFRNVALNQLEEVGAAALPYVFRAAFDETETGNSTNDHQNRICDEAAAAIHQLTGGRFGWSYTIPDDAKVREEILAAFRAEARRLGHHR